MGAFALSQDRRASRAREPRLNRDSTWALGVFAVCLALYWPALAPSVVKGDGGEMQMLSYVLGVSHRTGYPLYLMLGWLVTHLPLGGDVAYRLTLFSMLNAAAAMAVFYLLQRELDLRREVAIISSLLLASTQRLWMHAAAAEVYTMSVLLLLLGSWLLVRWGKGKTPLWCVTLVFGLALTHHISIRLMGPAVLVYVLLVEPRLPLQPRKWLPALATLLLPLGLYALVPWRAAYFQSLPELQGDILGVSKAVASGYVSPWYVGSGPVEFFLATGYSGEVLSGVGLKLNALAQYLGMVRQQYPLLAVAPFALLGFGVALVRRTRFAAYLVLAYVITTWAALRFLAEVGGGGNQLITGHVVSVLWFAFGANQLLEWVHQRWRLDGWRRAVPVALLACIPLYNVVSHYPEAMAWREIDTKPESLEVLEQPMPEGAVVAGPWIETTPLRYLQRVEGIRPDLWIIHADQAGIASVLLPEALAQEVPFYVLRVTEAGLRLLPVPARAGTAISHPADVRLGDVVRWKGYDLASTQMVPGAAVPITLYWQVESPPDRNWTTFIHLLDGNGERVAQVDRQPLDQMYPPTAWQPGTLLADPYELLLPVDLAPGRYSLTFGWYEGSDRLNWEDGQNFHLMGVFEVRAS